MAIVNQNYKKVTLHHSLLKKELHVLLGTISGWHYSDSSKATHVYTTAGVFPVDESPETVTKLIQEQAVEATITASNIVATQKGEE
jgi:enamine deaminase RidA (YjgF/YER057c/UK114 family)